MENDNAITTTEEDRFQRDEIAQRLARMIHNRNGKACFSIGIDGKWGTGKTSFINLLINHLDDNVAVLNFNPWRYSSEEELLKNFYAQLLDLHSVKKLIWRQKVGKALKVSSMIIELVKPIIKPFSNKLNIVAIGEVEVLANSVQTFAELLKTVSKLIEEISLERFKSVVADSLDSDKHTVIVLDDIDRLSKEEHLILFKLIKLNADFNNTTFLVALDWNNVSQSISNHFGYKPEQGEDYLEKIINLRFPLPKPKHIDLLNLLFEKIEQCLKDSGCVLQESDSRRVGNTLQRTLTTGELSPRRIKDVSNQLQLMLPMINKELNIADFILLRCLSVFFYDAYRLLINHKELFVGSNYNSTGTIPDEDKHSRLMSELDKLYPRKAGNDSHRVITFLQELFPETFTDRRPRYYESSEYIEWQQDQRICSTEYFDRYFSLTVHPSEFSDADIDIFLNSDVENKNADELALMIIRFSKQQNFKDFFHKFILLEEQIPNRLLEKLSITLAISSNCFYDIPTFNGWFSSKIGISVVNMIGRFLGRIESPTSRLQIAQSVVWRSSYPAFALSYVSFVEFRGKDNIIDYFNEFESNNLLLLTYDRIMEKYSDKFVCKNIERESSHLFKIGEKFKSEQQRSYIGKFINQDHNNCIDLLKAYCVLITPSSKYAYPYWEDFNNACYAALAEVFDTNTVYDTLQKIYTLDELHIPPVWDKNSPESFDDLNMARQFVFHHTKSAEEINSEQIE